MITIKELTWDNWFSYGDSNKLTLDDAKLMQITGVNGTGKSSIPVIIGEVLTGKNAFGKTKQKLFNRYLDKPTLKATILLEKDGKEYHITYSRKTALKLVLLEDGKDISSHSSTNTLKTINEILGFEFKVLWQLIYQSSTHNLAFLNDTDTNRKKFLIELFSLDKYLENHEQFKRINRELNNELLSLRGKQSQVSSWLEKNEKEDLTLRELESVPMIAKDDVDNLTDLKVELANIATTNKHINDNNQYISLLQELDTTILNETTFSTLGGTEESLNKEKQALWNKIGSSGQLIEVHDEYARKLERLEDTCPTCEQVVDIELIRDLIHKSNKIIVKNTEIDKSSRDAIKVIDTSLKSLADFHLHNRKREKVSAELQNLLEKIDKNLPKEVKNAEDIQHQITELNNTITNINSAIKVVTKRNLEVEAHNSKVKVIEEQLVEYKLQLTTLQEEINKKEFTVNKVAVIIKAFSTNGLLNYKIEYLVKDLEHQINSYLEELSNGRFQMLFTLNGEKLDIEIIDDGKHIGIEELSAGETARINTSTLLAIRKLMAAISSTKLNILFLDEVLGVLDDEGKEKLIDILTAEEDLNTFLVSHEYSHPLIPTINLVKENKISRIE
jgi:DNA repair exonuclease SbcCD ATPase subunit